MSDIKIPIEDWEIYDLKKAIAGFIVPRLELYKQWLDDGKLRSLPTWVENDYDPHKHDQATLYSKWQTEIEYMIEGFKYLSGVDDLDWTNMEESNRKMQLALDLLHKRFNDLWD